jgi:hypothetical protein
MHRRILASASALLFTCSAAVNLLAATCPQHPAIASLEILAFDQSDSITLPQLAEWEPIAQSILNHLCPAAHLQIFAIHNNTLNSRPLFDDSMPSPLPSNPTVDQRIVFKHQILTFRQKAGDALKLAVHHSVTATSTDIFSLFDRIHHAPSQPVHLVIFSDALHSNPELNLEKISLKSAPPGPLIQRLATRHGWNSSTLAGVSVAFVLPSLQGGKDKSPGPNDRFALHDFYRSLTTALGGTFSSFETQLGGTL